MQVFYNWNEFIFAFNNAKLFSYSASAAHKKQLLKLKPFLSISFPLVIELSFYFERIVIKADKIKKKVKNSKFKNKKLWNGLIYINWNIK